MQKEELKVGSAEEFLRKVQLLPYACYILTYIKRTKQKYNFRPLKTSIFTVYAVFQNLLGGATIFLNLTVLFRHLIYIA